jgi:hypothetical protein
MRGHMLEVDFLTLDPKIFDNIQDFFTKFKDLLSQLKSCGVDKLTEEKQMVLTILSKIGPKLFVFISTFHTVRFTSGATWKMPSLEDFIESLTQEKTKLINMGAINGPRAYALTIHDGSHKYQRSKDKYKKKSHAHTKKEGYTKPFTDASGSKGEKGRKGKKRREIHILSQRIPFGICMHAKENRYDVSDTSTRQHWISHPPGCKEKEARRSEFQERQF